MRRSLLHSARALIPATLIGLVFAGCGADPSNTQSMALSCGITADCPAGQECGPDGYCVGPGASGLPDGGGIGDGQSGGDVSFGSSDGNVSFDAGRGGVDTGGRGQDTGGATGGDTAGRGGADAGEATSCEGRCGAVTGGCACNSDCAAAGNCCDDYDAVCGGGGQRGECQSAAQCDDGLPCTLDTCTAGKCANTPGPNACLIDGKCVASGAKGPGICLVCAPQAKKTGWTMDVGGSCDDGEVCTESDACTAQGTCKGTPKLGCCTNDSACATTLPCQQGSCDLTTNTCAYAAKPGCCAKDSDCAGNTQPCQVLWCNPTIQACDVKSASDGATCDDGDGCTVGDTCTTGFCVGKANTCDDNDPCTADSCQGGKCVNAPQAGCCKAGACCDLGLSKPKTKGTVCGQDVLATELRCQGQAIEQRVANPGCNGTDATCGKAQGDQVWGQWTTKQTCAAGQTCVEAVQGQPKCQTSTVAKADLVPVAFKSTKTSYVAGSSVVVTGSAKNQGKASAGGFTVEYRLSTNSGITTVDKLLKTVTKTGLAGGASTSLVTSFTLPATTKPGTYYLGVWLDRSNKVSEASTSNNIASYKITVTGAATKADLVPVGFKSTKTSYTAGSSVVVTGSVKNQGGASAGAFSLEWRLSTNSGISTVDPLLKTLGKTGLAAGASTSATTSFTLPASTKPGTYYLGLWIDRANKVSEASTSNNIGIYKITVTAPAKKPDLQVVSFKTTTTTYEAGKTAFVTGSMKNGGPASAGSFKYEYRLSTNNIISTGDPLLKTLTRSSLSAGGSASLYTSLVIPANTTPGTYYVGVRLDSAGAISELSEANNTASYKITVTAPAKKPDLQVVSFKTTTTTYQAGKLATVSGTMKNAGTASAGSFKFEYRLSTNSAITSSDTLLKTLTRSSLSAGGSASLSTSVLIPANTAPGTYYVGVRLDSTGAISELSESNNTAAYKITVTAPAKKADLVPQSFKSSKTTYYAGETVTVYGSVKNQGTAAAGAFDMEWRLSPNSGLSTIDTLLKTLSRTGLNAGSTTSAFTSFTLPASTKPGTYYLGIWVDRANKVSESSTLNNKAVYKITVTAPPKKPDLQVVSLKTSTTTYEAGKSVYVSGSMKNAGTASAGTFKYEYRLSSNTTISTSDVLLKTLTRSSLSAGGTGSLSTYVVIPANTKPGTWYVGVRLDSGGAISELSETNNTASYKITVTAPAKKPDLVPVSFKSSKTSYAPGDTVTVYGSIKNQGTATAGSSTVEWRLSDNTVVSSGDTLLKTLSKGSITAGSSTSALTSFKLPTTTKPGTWYLTIKADAGSQVSELSESNNTATYKITVTGTPTAKPDLQIAAFKPAKTSAVPGSTVTLTASVKNAGGAAGAFTVAYRLSTNTSITAGDPLLLVRERSGLSAGGTSSVSTTVTIPSYITAGTWYLAIKVDDGGAVSETSESNNVQYVKFKVSGKVTAKPDLVPYLFKTSSTTFTPGSIINLSGYVKNQGTLSSGNFKIEFRLSTNYAITASDTLLKTVSKSSLSKGGLSNIATSVKLPTSLTKGKTYWLGLRVDSASQVSEGLESNNIGTWPIVIQ